MGRMTGTWRKIGTGRRRGIALVIVLWGLVLLAVIAAAFTTETRTEVALARNLVENAKARALADAGVYRAILGLLAPDVEQRWFADVPFYTLASDAGEVSIAIEDEAGKIDLNAAPDELVQGLFIAIGVKEAQAAALTAAIADFRDPDDETHLGGAEADDYRAAGLAWGPKNNPFEAIEELHQVLGMTREIFRLAAPGLTVHSRSRGVDVTVAPLLVLRALPGVDAEAVEAFAAQRAEQTGQGPPEEGPLEGGRVTGATVTALPGLGRRYAARSRGRVFTVRAEATTRTGAVFVREAVISMTRNIERPFEIHAWRRGQRTLSGPSVSRFWKGRLAVEVPGALGTP